jgi:hypothetical protein
MARNWKVKSKFPAGRKAALCQQPSIESRWFNEVIEGRFAGIEDSDGNFSDTVRIQ